MGTPLSLGPAVNQSCESKLIVVSCVLPSVVVECDLSLKGVFG